MASTALEDAAILSKLQPVEYYKKWIEALYPTRPNGRKVDDFLPVKIIAGPIENADFSTTVNVGGTIVVVTAFFEVCEAPVSPKQPRGHIVPNVTFCAGCSPVIRAGPPGERAQVLSKQVSDIINRIIDLDALLFAEGRLVWVLYIDALVVSDAGSVFSAIWLGVIAVLKSLRFPPVRIDEKNGVALYGDATDGGSTVVFKANPVPLNFAYIAEKDALIADPDENEECVLDGQTLTMLVDQKSKSIIYYECQSIPSRIFELNFLEHAPVNSQLNVLADLLNQ